MDKSDRGGAGLIARFAGFGRFLRHAVRRYRRDNGLQVAAALSYSSLLAMVPMAAITLALISAMPALDEVRADLLFDIYSTVLPQTQIEISEHFEDLVKNAGNMTVFGLIGLAVMVVLLFSTVVQTLNRIWRVTRPRPFLLQFSIYLSLLIFGPILFGASLTLTSYLFAIAEERGYTEYRNMRPMPRACPGSPMRCRWSSPGSVIRWSTFWCPTPACGCATPRPAAWSPPCCSRS